MEWVDSLEPLAKRFDAFLVDQFGVLLGGDGAYPFAPAALQRLAQTGKPVVVLSNSGKRAQPNIDRLVHAGFDRPSFRAVLSSGEVAHGLLARRIGADIPRGAATLVLSRNGDLSGIEGLDLNLVSDPDKAELILLSASRGDETTLDAYAALLEGPAARGVPCLCTNPDMTMLTPKGPRFGAGRIAELYASLGGSVDWCGKPHPQMYAAAAGLLPDIAADRVLCIGDSPDHDILGGQRAGHATALVRTGIHADLSDADIRDQCLAIGAGPDFLLPRFSFEIEAEN